jgi:hypothetical protein
VRRHLRRAAAIYLDRLLPVGSPDITGSDLPAVITRAEYQLLGFAGGGVYPADTVTGTAVRSYRTISPLPVSRRIGAIGCVFSVALSCELPRVAVNHHRALSCSDFPPALLKPATARPTLLIDYLLPVIIAKVRLIFHFLPRDFDMLFEVLIVGFGEIAPEVYAPTLLSHLSCVRHKPGDG